MKKIKTQALPVGVHTVSNTKSEAIKVSGKDFKKALDNMVSQESPSTDATKDISKEAVEKEKQSYETELDTSVEKDEEAEKSEIPLFVLTAIVQPDTTKYNVDIDFEVDSEKSDIAIDVNELMTESVIDSDQLVYIEQPIFVLSNQDAEIVAATETSDLSENTVQQGIQPATELDKTVSKSIINASIVESELEVQVKRSAQELSNGIESTPATTESAHSQKETSVLGSENNIDQPIDTKVETNITFTEEVSLKDDSVINTKNDQNIESAHSQKETSVLGSENNIDQPIDTKVETNITFTEEVSLKDDSVINTKNDQNIESKDTESVSNPDQMKNASELDVKESSDKTQNTDISASGQWTQIKLSATQPQTQTETIKVIPQEQIVQEIETMIVEDLSDSSQVEKVSTTRIQLTPKHLGEMDIELVMKDKELTARLVVEKAETKQLLEQKLTQLTNTLAEQDIKVEQFEVEVSSNQPGFGESSMDEQSFLKEQERAFRQRRIANNRSIEEQQVVSEQTERNLHANTGRLSMWV